MGTEASTEKQGNQEGSGSRVIHRQTSSSHQDVLQVREEDRHQELWRQEETVRGRSWQSSRRGQLRDYQSGSVSGQARRLVIQRLLKAKREELVKKRRSSRRRKRRRKRRRRRRRRSKS